MGNYHLFSTNKGILTFLLNLLILKMVKRCLTGTLLMSASEYVTIQENGFTKLRKESPSLKEKFKLNFIMDQLAL